MKLPITQLSQFMLRQSNRKAFLSISKLIFRHFITRILFLRIITDNSFLRIFKYSRSYRASASSLHIRKEAAIRTSWSNRKN